MAWLISALGTGISRWIKLANLSEYGSDALDVFVSAVLENTEKLSGKVDQRPSGGIFPIIHLRDSFSATSVVS